ncbi:MAG: homoserine O-acetyltransferase [Phycicoccus sp.]|nr:homoserine O-acetyltransferase [Phycicoccus sp.]
MSAQPVPPSSTIRRPGGSEGDKQFLDLGSVDLELGDRLPECTVAFETWGVLSPKRDNAILVEHALTGDSHVVGPAGPGHPTVGWWEGLIGPGRPLDTRDVFIVSTNVLGGCQGTTGPSSPGPRGRAWGGDFPRITIRDQVEVEARVADALGVQRWHTVLGGSMGGMRSLEWCVMFPERVARALILASSAYASADQIAWCQAQVLAIQADPAYQSGHYYASGSAPLTGLGIARRIAHLTYRSERELADRFGRRPQAGEDPGAGGRYAVESYLDHAADKLTARFDAGSYVTLTQAMGSHDVGRGRGGVNAALGRVSARMWVAHVDSDRCYPPRLSSEIVRAVPDSLPVAITSSHGHDGFLVETEQVGRLIREVVGTPLAGRSEQDARGAAPSAPATDQEEPVREQRQQGRGDTDARSNGEVHGSLDAE